MQKGLFRERERERERQTESQFSAQMQGWRKLFVQDPRQWQVRNCHVRFIRGPAHRRVANLCSVLTRFKRARVDPPSMLPNQPLWEFHEISNVSSNYLV